MVYKTVLNMNLLYQKLYNVLGNQVREAILSDPSACIVII